MTNRERYDQWFTNYHARLNAAEFHRVLGSVSLQKPNEYLEPYYRRQIEEAVSRPPLLGPGIPAHIWWPFS